MVGRERERASLRQAFDRAVGDSSCHLFTVLGPAGVGKSRLVAELVRELGDEARVLSGRCLPYGDGITFRPLYEVLDELGERSSTVRGLLEGGTSAPEELFFTVRKLLEEIARERQLVVVFDDVQWAEPTFLDFVDHVSDWSRDAPILVVCLARPELLDERPAWGGGKLNATSVLLEPLSESDCEVLLRNLLGGSLTEAAQARILAAAEGNPLFVEEMLEMLIDDGLLERRNGSWAAVVDLGDVSVPPTIHALLGARLDRLSSEERAVAERAAVEGKLFHRGAVAALAPEPLRPEVSVHLLSLVRKELVRPDEPEFADEDAFRFRHLLLRDAAYESIPKEARAELHEAYAGWLEEKVGDRRAEYEAILAYHLDQSFRYRADLGLPEEALARRAAELFVSSGRRALAAGDRNAARSLLGRAAELLPRDDPARLALLPDLGTVLDEGGDHARAGEVLAEAVELARAAADERTECRASLALLRGRMYFESQIDVEKLIGEAEQLSPLFERLGDERGQADTLLLLGELSWSQCQAGRTAELVEHARAHALRAGDHRLELEAVRHLALAWAWGPTPVTEALRLLDGLTTSDGLQPGIAATARARLEAMLGRFEAARRSLELGIAAREELGLHVVAATARAQIGGFIEELAGDLAAAERYLRRGVEELERFGERTYLMTTVGQLAGVLAAKGCWAEAETLARMVEENASPGDLLTHEWAARATVLAREGAFEAAEGFVQRGVEIAEETDFLSEQGDAYAALAEVQSLSGRADEAIVALEQALERYELKEYIVMADRMRERLAELRDLETK